MNRKNNDYGNKPKTQVKLSPEDMERVTKERAADIASQIVVHAIQNNVFAQEGDNGLIVDLYTKMHTAVINSVAPSTIIKL